MFLFVHELIGNFDLQKQSCGIDLIRGTRLLMLAGLKKISAIDWAVEGYLALFAATLRADAAVHSWAKALLLANFTDGAGQPGLLAIIIAFGMRFLRFRKTRRRFQIADSRFQTSNWALAAQAFQSEISNHPSEIASRFTTLVRMSGPFW